MASGLAMAQLTRKRCLNVNAETLPADRAAFQRFLNDAINGRAPYGIDFPAERVMAQMAVANDLQKQESMAVFLKKAIRWKTIDNWLTSSLKIAICDIKLRTTNYWELP